MSAYLDSLVDRRNAVVEASNTILDGAAAENREMTDDERAKVVEYNAEAKRLEDEHATLSGAEDRAAKFAEASKSRARAEVRERADARRADDKADDGTEPERTETRSMGRVFVESEAFLNYKGRGSSDAVEFADFLGIEARAAITSADLAIPPHQFTGRIGYVTTTPLLDAIGREVVNTNSVTYIDWGTTDPLAGGPIAEGELKPEATITPTEVPLALSTYAHWKALTRQALEDYPRIQSIVEGKLRGGVANRLEQGAAEAIAAATLTGVTGETLLEGIRVGVATVQAEGFVPNAVLLNPSDYAALDIAAAAGSNSGPTSFGAFWGLTPIPAGAVTAGTAYVGDFRQGVTWFDRNVTSVFMTDSHADYFVRNLLVILAEARAAFAVTDALALAEVTAAPVVPEAAAAKSSK